MDHKSSFMRRSSSRKYHLFERNKYISYKIGAIYFDMISESVDNIEATGIPYDCKYNFLLWISCLDFVTISSLDGIHMRRGDIL
jgi:hypothetical protein